MLAAGDGQDIFDISPDGMIQRVIRSGVAGMEGDYHINWVTTVVFADVAVFESKLGVIVLAGYLIAVVNYIFFLNPCRPF